MWRIQTIEQEWNILKNSNQHGTFEYGTASKAFKDSCNAHFDQIERPHKHGIYIIRQKTTNHILYIGKGGTIKNEGGFRKQDIPQRLKNTRNNTASNEWFNDLRQEKGDLIIEYVFLDTTPLSPALAETILLQAYLNEYGQLPYRNKTF